MTEISYTFETGNLKMNNLNYPGFPTSVLICDYNGLIINNPIDNDQFSYIDGNANSQKLYRSIVNSSISSLETSNVSLLSGDFSANPYGSGLYYINISILNNTTNNTYTTTLKYSLYMASGTKNIYQISSESWPSLTGLLTFSLSNSSDTQLILTITNVSTDDYSYSIFTDYKPYIYGL